MEFINYMHIENFSPELASISKYHTWHPEAETTEWVASEKIDGANFQFVVNSQEVICCSRNKVLDFKNGSFHNFQKLAEKYDASVRAVFKWCCEKEGCGEDSLVVRIYGEIFGGLYPEVGWDWESPKRPQRMPVGSGEGTAVSGDGATADSESAACVIDVSRIRVKPNNKKGIQQRVFYIPDIDFYLFDISYLRLDAESPDDDEDNDDAEDNDDDDDDDDEYASAPSYLDIDELVQLTSKCGFTYVAQPLHRGTFSELCKLLPKFPSTIPALVGLPEQPDNYAEGYVLRPLRSLDRRRPYRLKLKNEAFAEFTKVVGKRKVTVSGVAPAVANSANGISFAKMRLSEQGELADHLASGLTVNRLAGVMSKLEQNFMRRMDNRYLASLLIDDAMAEITTDRPDINGLFSNLDIKIARKLKASVFSSALDVVVKNRHVFS